MTTRLFVLQQRPCRRTLCLIGLLVLLALGAVPSRAFSPDTLIAPVFDTLSTGCTRLIVGSNGNMGHQGMGRVNMDYWDFGDCDTVDSIPGETERYLSDASPIIIRKLASPDTVIAIWSMFGDGPGSAYGFLPVIDQVPPIAAPLHTNTATYQKFTSGQFVTVDSQLAVELTYWAPTTADSCNFIIQKMVVFSRNGTTQNNLTIGQAFDFDVPSDTDVFNDGGFDAALNLVFQQGYEYKSESGRECQKSNRRYAGAAMLGYYKQSEYSDYECTNHTDMFGGYTAASGDYIYPQNGFVPRALWTNMSNPGLAADPVKEDQHTLLTYKYNYSLPGNDSLVVYTAIASIRNGTSADLQNSISKAKKWYLGNIRIVACIPCMCSAPPGNVDGDRFDQTDIADLTAMVDYMFFGVNFEGCWDEVDVDRSGWIDISDLQVLVDFLFFGAVLHCY